MKVTSKSKSDKSLNISNDLVNNSKLAKSSLDLTKKIIPPLTKSIDMAVVSLLSILLYKAYIEFF
tara:strand:- start:2088 stop:2282 length:195 start_codon:yes stop_codon:yes gene_type:complete